jgi:hypothetical protein
MAVLPPDCDEEELLQQADPFNNNQVIYSEIVHLLSTIVDNGVPLLEKFVNQSSAT